MPDLVTSAEVLAALTSLTDAQKNDLAATIAAASRAIESYLDRPIALANFDELYDPGRSRIVHLRNYPVADVSRVAAGAVAVLSARATDPAFSRAAVSYTFAGDPPYAAPSGLKLASTTAGAATSETLTAAAYPTVADLATAIGAVSGWSATAADPWGIVATADLTPEVGARDAMPTGAGVDLFALVGGVSDYDLEPLRGTLTLGPGWPRGLTAFPFADTYRFPDMAWGVSPRFGQVRVSYSAGYATIPDDVTRAAIMTVKAVLDSTPFSGTFSAEKVSAGNSTYSYSLLGTPAAIPPVARALLSNYRKIRV